MTRRRIAIVGYGRVGAACGSAVLAAQDCELAGFVRRSQSLSGRLPESFRGVAVAGHVSELTRLDAVLVCVPPDRTIEVTQDVLQHGLPAIECAIHHGDAFRRHKAQLHHLALRHRRPVVAGAGWDPGALSLIRDLFDLLTPKGDTAVIDRPGVSLHHSLSARTVKGVKDALCAELRDSGGRLQRYVYVELANGADAAQVARDIRSDPLFLGEDTQVFPVDSVAALEEQSHGIVVERRGRSGSTAHQIFLLEARFDLPTLAAQVMVAAARAIAGRPPGAYSLLDLPLGSLWGEVRAARETALI